VEITSTPIHDSTVAVVRGGLPRDTVRPPRHPDIYAELCARLGYHRDEEIQLPQQRRGDNAGLG
jgi:hypothetical protein